LSETYTVYAYFSTSPTSTDGQTFILSVDGDTDLTVGGSGTQMGTTTAVNNSTGSTMDVFRSQLIFSTQPPASAATDTDFSGTIAVSATDVNNNVDTDFSENITLSAVITGTHTAPGGTLTSTDTGGTTKSPTSGVATWTDTKYDVGETIDIKAVSATYGSGIFSTAVAVTAPSILVLADHAAGQESDRLNDDVLQTGVEFFAFQLSNSTGSPITLTDVVFQLSSVNGMLEGDFENFYIYVDADGSGDIEGGETTKVCGVTEATTAITGSTGTITFGSCGYDISDSDSDMVTYDGEFGADQGNDIAVDS